LARPPTRAPRVTAWFLGGLLFVVGGIISSYAAVSPLGSLQVVANGVFVLFVWQWTTRHLLDTPGKTQSAMWAYVVGTAFSAAIAIVQELAHTSLGLNSVSGSTGSSRAIGLAQQPNIAAVTFGLAIVFAIGIAFEKGTAKGRWLRLALIVELGIALMFTGSVSGMAGTLLGVGLLLVRRGFQLRNLLAVAAVLVAVYFGGTHLESSIGHNNLNPFARVHAATGQNTGYNTVSPRFATYHYVWTKIEESPLVGHGLDTRSSLVYFDPYQNVSYPTHDFPLLLWYEGGILFVLAAAITMGSTLGRVWRGTRYPVKDALLAGGVTVLVYSLGGPELFDRWLWLPFVLALTLRPGATPSDTGEEAAAEQPDRAQGAEAALPAPPAEA